MPSFTYAECISNGWNPYLSSLAILITYQNHNENNSNSQTSKDKWCRMTRR